MKQNITLSLDAKLLKQARALAAKRRLSVSGLLAEDLAAKVAGTRTYEQARKQALEFLDRKFPLGGGTRPSRDELHDRPGLR